jgi:hypothetical protein
MRTHIFWPLALLALGIGETQIRAQEPISSVTATYSESSGSRTKSGGWYVRISASVSRNVGQVGVGRRPSVPVTVGATVQPIVIVPVPSTGASGVDLDVVRPSLRFGPAGEKVAPRAADVQSPKQAAKEKVEDMNAALLKGYYGKVANYTHPSVVKLAGGQDKMRVVVELMVKQLKEKGTEIRSLRTGEPGEPIRAGADLYIVVPYRLEMQAKVGTIKQNLFVIGVSPDSGNTWTFVNGDVPPEQTHWLLPDLPKNLKLPAREKSVVEKQ